MRRITVTVQDSEMRERQGYSLALLFREKLEQAGIRGFTGKYETGKEDYEMCHYMNYVLSPRDILFLRFDIGYVPKWKLDAEKRREILSRKW